jgi:hypothetical protein
LYILENGTISSLLKKLHIICPSPPPPLAPSSYVNRFNTTYGFNAVGGGGGDDDDGDDGGDDDTVDTASSGRRMLIELKDQARTHKDANEEILQSKPTTTSSLKMSGLHVAKLSDNKKEGTEMSFDKVKNSMSKLTASYLRRRSSRSSEDVMRSTTSSKDVKRRLAGTASEFGSVDCSTVFNVMQYDSWYDFSKKVKEEQEGDTYPRIYVYILVEHHK